MTGLDLKKASLAAYHAPVLPNPDVFHDNDFSVVFPHPDVNH